MIAGILTGATINSAVCAADTNVKLERNLETNLVSGEWFVGNDTLYDAVTVKVTNPDGKVIYLDQVYADEAGRAKFDYIHNADNAGAGLITVVLSHNDEVVSVTYKVADPDLINTIIGQIQSECLKEQPDYAAIKNAYLGADENADGIPDNAEILNLNLEVYNTLTNKDKVFSILGSDPANDSIAGINDIKKAFYDAAALAKISESNSTAAVTELMQNELYSDIFKKDSLPKTPDGKSVLDVLSETVKTKVYDRILLAGITQKEKFSSSFALFVLAEGLRYGEWQDNLKLLKAYSDAKLITIDYSVYNTLKNKTAVDKAMSGKEYNSYQEIKDTFEAAAEAAEKNAGKKPSSSGGGGGGGGLTVSTLPAAQKSTEENNIAEKIVKTDISGVPLFDDMTEAKWAIEAVEALYKKNIVNGAGENSFEPNRGITRAEFVKMLVCMADIEPVNENVFNDVTPGDWFYPYAAAAYNARISEGDENKNFNGGNLINREEMSAMVHRLINMMNVKLAQSDTAEFDDADTISPWALDSVNYLKGGGVLNGRSKNYFEPKAVLTRAEAAVVIYNVINKGGI